MLVELVAAAVAVLGALYLYITRNFNFWAVRGVVFIEPWSAFGAVWNQILGKVDTSTQMQRWYTEYKRQGLRFVGTITVAEPTLILLDLDLCKHILTKDFHHFTERNLSPTTHEYISKHLFSLEGQEWKDMRTKLTPTFTSGKMKSMFQLMERCADQLQDHIDNVVLQKGEFQVKDLIARFTTDIIATCAFGLEVNSIKDRDHEFYKVGLLMFAPKMSLILKMLMHKAFPLISKFLRLNTMDPKISIFLSRIMKDSIEYRTKNKVVRNDFVDLLIQVKESKFQESYEKSEDNSEQNTSTINSHNEKHRSRNPEECLTLEQMTAQAFVFILAGFETAASTTSFCLYELAKDTAVQERLRQEIDEVLANYDNKITYQALQDMTYMDQVVNETLRRYASLPFLTRVCTEKYKLPGTDLIIETGVRVIIPSYAIHHDPELYPEPYKFDPDRFSENNARYRHQYAFIPFGEGPRNCIGMRFGRLQVKISLAAILSRYQLSPAPDTPTRLELNPFSVFTTPKQPFSLNISKRSNRP